MEALCCVLVVTVIIILAVSIIPEGLSLKMPLVVGETLTSLLLEVDTHVTCEKCKYILGTNRYMLLTYMIQSDRSNQWTG